MQDLKKTTEISPPTITWYRTRAGKVFLSILVFIIIITVVFMALTGYYLWQIKYGSEPEKLAQQFSSSFTSDPARALLNASNTVTEDVNKYIYPTTPIFGARNATITIIAFIDFECPYSQESYRIFKEITEKYAPVIKVAFKNMPITGLHPDIMPAHLAAACAQEQNKFWEYHDLLFTNKKFDAASLDEYADKLKLNKKQFSDCLSSEKYKSVIDKDLYDSSMFNVRGTPTYIINQTKLEGVIPKDYWDKIILENLKKSL